MDNTEIKTVCDKFGLQGQYLCFKTINYGHINSTYQVYFLRDDEIKDYIVQRINTYVFKNPVEVMENIANITEYIRAKIKATGTTAKRLVLHYSTTEDGSYYFNDGKGGFWRCCRYIDDSMTFNIVDSPFVIEQAGKAFGEFQMCLADYPIETLHITIPHFHNTVMRYKNFRKSVEKDVAGRKAEVLDEIQEYLDFEKIATKMYKMQKKGQLPLRVTHNDTKTNNVLFDRSTLHHLSVIDLDTVMPGLVGFDFGDAIRYAGNTASEDETDLSKVKLDLGKYEAFTKGFVSKLGNTLTKEEKNTLALGAIAMTVECGLRFLTDYLDGDKYFKTDYEKHNLDRARCQLALAKDMLAHFSEMKKIVRKYCKD